MFCRFITFHIVLVLGTCAIGSDGQHAYPFATQPRDALAVVEELKPLAGQVSYEPCLAELEAVNSIQSTEQSNQLWANAFLVASGECDTSSRKKHLQQLDALTGELEKLVANRTVREKGEIILAHLHSGVMANGYDLHQSSLAALLDTGKFNCVSSTVLYQVVCARLGIQLKFVEFEGTAGSEGHVLPVIIAADEFIDVETTNAGGFDIRARIAKGEITSPGTRELKKGIEIDAKGLLRVLYNNRCVGFEEAEQNFDVIRTVLTMLILEPDSVQLHNRLEGRFINWSAELSGENQPAQAIQVGRVGLKISPEAAKLHNNMKVAYAALAGKLIEDKNDQGVAALYKTAMETWPTQKYDVELKTAFELAAQSASMAEHWEDAIAILMRGSKIAREDTRSEFNDRCKTLYRLWSQKEMMAGQFKASAKVLSQAITAFPDDKEIYDGVDFLAQESFEKMDADENGDSLELLKWQQELASTFPKSKNLGAIANSHVNRRLSTMLEKNEFERAREYLKNRASGASRSKLITAAEATSFAADIFDREAQSYFKAKDWEKAAKVYDQALAQFPGNEHLVHNAEYTYNQWASVSMEKKQWSDALAVYKSGLKILPNSQLFRDNTKYCEQFLTNE